MALQTWASISSSCEACPFSTLSPYFNLRLQLSLFNLLSSQNTPVTFCFFSSTSSSALRSSLHKCIWGPALVLSCEGYRYYVAFVDDYTRFTIIQKSNIVYVFITFQHLAELLFNFKIKSIQSEWGGKFHSLSHLLKSKGILHWLSCPHTHHQNGAFERKHRHIVETGLALMAHVSLP